ncbi:MAG: KH domain-containing protein [Methanoculleaceae archaeon]
MTVQELKMNGTRIGVLIGHGGSTKREVEKRTGTRLQIDSDEGIVTIESEDPVGVMDAADVITAINRGFSPERAFRLLEDEEIILEVIDISHAAGSPKQLERIRGRIIGKGGRSRRQIEDMTGADISVFGKTVALIGRPDQLKTARKAIDMLLRGVSHEQVYAYLERRAREKMAGDLGFPI